MVSVTFDNPRHRTTYREVFRRARKLANALVAAGIKPGDRVATLAWNDYRHLELYYAVSCMGAVLHTVNPRLFPEQLEYIVNHAEDRLIFIDPTLAAGARARWPGKIPTVERVIVMTRRRQPCRDAVKGKLSDYESFIAAHPEEFDWPDLDERSASSLCYTSGTTGNPKGVLYSHRSNVLHAYAGCMADSHGPVAAATRCSRSCRCSTRIRGACLQRADDGREARVPGPEDGRRGDADPAHERRARHARRRACPPIWTLLLNHLRQIGHEARDPEPHGRSAARRSRCR